MTINDKKLLVKYDHKMNTFVDLYREGCRLTDDIEEEHIARYEDLDALWKFIKENPDREHFERALSIDRVCIVISYDFFRDKRLPPDTMIDGKPVIYASPGNDYYRSLLVDRMQDTTIPAVNKWKLGRLAKVVDMGWDKFVEQYLEPLRDKEAYFESLLTGRSNK